MDYGVQQVVEEQQQEKEQLRIHVLFIWYDFIFVAKEEDSAFVGEKRERQFGGSSVDHQEDE